jgi:hypothetical protein
MDQYLNCPDRLQVGLTEGMKETLRNKGTPKLNALMYLFYFIPAR